MPVGWCVVRWPQAAHHELQTLAATAAANAALQEANAALKQQLDAYHDKFTEFQGTLTKSNEVRDDYCGLLD
jgi:hypothetical protein